MNCYYLRIEGVNQRNFVEDTQKLAAIRGGSALLLNAIQCVEAYLRSKKIAHDKISSGASSGLFEITIDADNDMHADSKALAIQDGIVEFLNTHPTLRHATFVVDCVPHHDSHIIDRERTIALNRWRQVQAPSLAIPDTNTDSKIEACRYDLIRPGTERHHDPDEGPICISASVHERYEHGRDRKQFYSKQLGYSPPMDFCLHFEELTNDPSKGNLHHKMGVIYFDGNGFTDIQSSLCLSKEKQREFDKKVQDLRAACLKKLIESMKNDPAWISRDGNFRFETLLWGGDEMTWVVPAWQGWKVMEFFYRESRDWEFCVPLLHAGGIVFCSHKAPIHRVTALARELAGLAKKRDRSKSLFAYEVLESFDHAGLNLEKYRKTRVPDWLDPQTLILNGDDIPSLTKTISDLGHLIPNRKMHAMIKEVFSCPSEVEFQKNLVLQSLKSGDSSGSIQKTLGEAAKLMKGNGALWLHFAALRQYIQ